MPDNPYYHLLTLRRPKLVPYVSKKQKSYFLLPIPLAEETENLILNGHAYTLKKHHVSIYQEYTKQSPLLSPIHYTGEYCAEDQSIIKIHVYFDKRNNLLLIKINRTDAERKKPACSITDEINIKNLIETYTNEILNNLSVDLINKKRENKIKKSEFLQKLERESLTSMTTPTYTALLDETIAFFEFHAKLEFYPDYKEIKFLKNHLLHLQNRMVAKKTAKNNRTQLVKSQSLTTQPVKEVPPQPTHESKEITSASKTSFVESKGLKEGAFTASQQLEIKERNLYQQLDSCSHDDLNEMLQITQQIDDLAKERCEVLIQGCIDGDLDLVKRNFRKIDADNPDTINLIAALLPTCVYHNRPDLFEYIFTEIKSRYVKLFLFVKPYVTLNPTTYPDTICTSMPSVAYTVKNIDFFTALLTRYRYNPNCSFMQIDSLLIRMASDPDALEYMKILLQAGADPDNLKEEAFFAFVCSDHQKEKITPESKLANYIKPVNQTPLHQAVWSRNIAAIQLLLQYSANSFLLNSDKLTPFGVALLDAPLNEEIISIFLSLGHQIDERQTLDSFTGFYYACQKNNMDAVLLFLKFKANPCAEHEATLLINKIPILVRATPLLVAAVNGHLAIVEKILACKIPREELAYTRQQCKKYGNSAKELLRQAYFAVCQNDAVETHKNAVKANEQKNYTQASTLFNTADDLYLQALKATKNDEDKHLILYNLATCRDKAGKKQEAIIALTQCIAIRQQLASNPIKKQRLQPLIVKAQTRLEAIKNAEEPRMHCSFSRLTA